MGETLRREPEFLSVADVLELRREIREIDHKLASVLPVPRLQELHLLDGLIDPSKYRSIVKRLDQDQMQKANLAKYLVDELRHGGSGDGNKPGKIFIESGSTLAHFSAELGQDIKRHPRADPLYILTNNFLTLTTFGVEGVEVSGGSLEPDYLAFLPFRNAHRKGRTGEQTEISEQHRAQDASAYRSLEATIAGVDEIYMTASGFGFLLGPHVGSRANALFKFCLLNNRARRRLKLCIAHSKVHWEDGWSTDVEDYVDKECYTVFYRGPRLEFADAGSELECLTDYKVMTRDLGDSGPEEDETPDKPRSAPAEMGLPLAQDQDGLCEGYGLTGLQGTWRSLLRDYRPGSLEIVIGLDDTDGRGRLKERLKRACDQANDILVTSKKEKGWALNRRYVEKKGTETDTRALHLVVMEAT